jgi:hypothetical protein
VGKKIKTISAHDYSLTYYNYERYDCGMYNDRRGGKRLRADKISTPGMIDSQVINLVIDAGLAVADLTERPPEQWPQTTCSGVRTQVSSVSASSIWIVAWWMPKRW